MPAGRPSDFKRAGLARSVRLRRHPDATLADPPRSPRFGPAVPTVGGSRTHGSPQRGSRGHPSAVSWTLHWPRLPGRCDQLFSMHSSPPSGFDRTGGVPFYGVQPERRCGEKRYCVVVITGDDHRAGRSRRTSVARSTRPNGEAPSSPSSPTTLALHPSLASSVGTVITSAGEPSGLEPAALPARRRVLRSAPRSCAARL